MARQNEPHSKIKLGDNVQEAYTVLAAVLSAYCGSDFADAKIIARLDDGFSDVEYVCSTASKTSAFLPSILESSKVDDALHELRKSMTVDGEEPWSRCTFTLFPDGKFKFDVEYDD